MAHNDLKLISSRTFEGFDKLDRIDITFNEVKNFSITSSDAPLVVEIELGGNEIETFPNFYGMMNVLKHLTLRYNQINYISPESFENITNLEYLDLAHNQLTEMRSVSHCLI